MRLFDFARPEALENWVVINDMVMGGISRAKFQAGPETGARFSGVVSLENNGGFASVRSAPQHFDLSDAAGIRLRCRGDRKTYKMTLRLEKSFDGVSWQSRFELTTDDWEEVDLPFDTFRPTWHGKLVPHAPPFDPAQITTLGLLIGDAQEGPFRLELAWIDALPPEEAA